MAKTIEQAQAEDLKRALAGDFSGLSAADFEIAKAALTEVERKRVEAATNGQREFEKRVLNMTDRERELYVQECDAQRYRNDPNKVTV